MNVNDFARWLQGFLANVTDTLSKDQVDQIKQELTTAIDTIVVPPSPPVAIDQFIPPPDHVTPQAMLDAVAAMKAKLGET